MSIFYISDAYKVIPNHSIQNKKSHFHPLYKLGWQAQNSITKAMFIGEINNSLSFILFSDT